ncbi:MAG TPA: phosphatase PAP2 family protein [Ktedonobacterales bacterium]|nr:phosphatase PAP2 family protein [Ktedonobacterales bacterium]
MGRSETRPVAGRTYPVWLRRGLLVVALAAAVASYEPLNTDTGRTHFLQSPLDAALPIVPVLAFPYVAFLPLGTLLFVTLAMQSWPRFRTLAVAFICFGVVADLCFIAFPTAVVRPVLAGDDLASSLVRLVYAHDRPFNDLPSTHVGGTVMFALACVRWRPRSLVVVAPLAAAIIASTVLIRQHSLLGAGAGLALGLACYALAVRLAPEEAVHASS